MGDIKTLKDIDKGLSSYFSFYLVFYVFMTFLSIVKVK